MLNTYGALVTAFNNLLSPPQIESCLTLVYAQDTQAATELAIADVIDSALSQKEGWSHHQVSLCAIPGQLVLGKSTPHIHLIAVRVFRNTSNGAADLKMALTYEISDHDYPQTMASVEADIRNRFPQSHGWTVIVDSLTKPAFFMAEQPTSGFGTLPYAN